MTDGIDILKSKLPHQPTGPGVYRMLNAKGDVLYVGKAKALRNRLASYTQPDRMGGRIRKMVFETRELIVVETRTEVEALLLEANLIKSLKPRYNIIFRDDASYLSVLITDEASPQIRPHRGARKVKGQYFGPYPSAGSVYTTLELMERAFRLRTCNATMFAHRTRPCLKYDIKRCSAPCVGKISPEDYKESVRKASRFLKGERQEVLTSLQADMKTKSDAMDYESAARIRDTIQALSGMASARTAMTHGLPDGDALAYVEEGGQAAVQVFSYRHSQHVGNQLVQMKNEDAEDPAELMRQFIAQHYASRAVPRTILCNIMPAEADMLAEALGLGAGHKVDITQPSRGEKALIIEQAETNARNALRRKQNEATTDWTSQLAELQSMLGLANPIQLVECYDISNIMGRHAVASQVVGGPKGMEKARYRKYAIQTKSTPDDYAMLHEVLSRRIKRAKGADADAPWALPDVFLIDGGVGQLNVLVKVAQELGLLDQPTCPALCSIAKGEERDKGLETIWQAVPNEGAEPTIRQLPIPHNTPLIFVLQRIRDEAHRFAITYHRAKRAKALTSSALDDIPGIGPAKKKALLLHFGSRAGVEGASIDDLLKVPGLSRKLAEVVYGYFHT